MGVTVDKKKVSTFIEINFSYFYLTPVWQIRVKRWMTQAAQSCCWACWRHQEGCQRQSGGPAWMGRERLLPWIVIRIMGNFRFCLLTWHSDVYFKFFSFCVNILACKFTWASWWSELLPYANRLGHQNEAADLHQVPVALLWVLDDASQGSNGVGAEEWWEGSGHRVAVEEGGVGWPWLDLVGRYVVTANKYHFIKKHYKNIG